MKSVFLSLSFLLILVSGCRKNPDRSILVASIQKQIEQGNLTTAILLADSLKSLSKNDRHLFLTADSLSEIAHRIRLDFSSTPDETYNAIEKRSGPVTPEQITFWENAGWLEGRMIDGHKMYFNRAASNLILLKSFHEGSEAAENNEAAARKTHTSEVLKDSDGKGKITTTKKFHIVYTIKVESDAIPENELIRCWLPWPQSGHLRQKNIKLISTSQPEFQISPDSAVHSTLFMEKKAQKGEPTVFRIEYEYESSAQWFDPDSIKPKPYDKLSGEYLKNTSEQLPHINFSPEVRRLADSICESETDPAVSVFKIWRWFKNNIPWTGAIEYSVLPDITAYACTNRRGDCGIQTMIFMSMLRYRGIPVKWQSGWKTPPFGKNLHDWCEVYFEGTGWVPVDVSYDLQLSDNMDLRVFFMSGMDSYRLMVNSDIAGKLFPEKEYLRSEPYDFQRGEVEWSGGNLYFDKWDYEMQIEYK